MENIRNNIVNNKKFKTIYQISPYLPDKKTERIKFPYCISKKKTLNIVNEIDIKAHYQNITFEIDVIDNLGKIFTQPPKTLKKQVGQFMKPFCRFKPGLSDDTKLQIQINGKNKIKEQSFSYYMDCCNRTILNFEDTKANIKKYTISISFYIGSSLHSRSRFISTIENNFEIFYQNYIVPFIR